MMIDFDTACNEKIDAGMCSADCCGAMPIPRVLWEEHMNTVRIKYKVEILGPLVLVRADDDPHCVFLDKVKSQCMIYEDRPDICRKFGPSEHVLLQCPHLNPDGTTRTRAQRRRHGRNSGDRMKIITNRFLEMMADEEIDFSE